MAEEAFIKRMIQIGKVVDRNEGELTCRVEFIESGMVSGWLKVLQQTDIYKASHHYIVSPTYPPADGEHPDWWLKTDWIPQIDDVVLVVYPYIRNSEGFIVGRIP